MAFFFFIAFLTTCTHTRLGEDCLLSFTDESTDQYGYRDPKGV
jgi:hypothetical protein